MSGTELRDAPTIARRAAPRRRRRVLMLLENNPYPQDVRVRQEAESLTAAGHHVTVLAPLANGQARREEVSGVEVRRYRLPVSSGSMLGFIAEYAVAHFKLFGGAVAGLARGADVIHLHNPPDTLFPAALVARAMGRSVVFDHHDLFPELLEEKLGSARLTRLAQLSQDASVRAASAVLVTNQSQADTLLRRGLGDGGQLTIVRNGPRASTFDNLRAPRDGVLEEPNLLFLGELDSQDGVLRLCDLLLEPGLERAQLTVVGDGPLRATLAARLREARIEDRVTFTGHVDHAQVAGLIARADICVDPAPGSDLNHRSTMIKVVEYLAACRPTVAFDLRETRYTAGPAALYARCDDIAEFASHVIRLAGDPSLREELAAHARVRRRELCWDRSEEALLAAYDRL